MRFITSFEFSTFAPFDKSNSTTSVCPSVIADIRAVYPHYNTAEMIVVGAKIVSSGIHNKRKIMLLIKSDTAF